MQQDVTSPVVPRPTPEMTGFPSGKGHKSYVFRDLFGQTA